MLAYNGGNILDCKKGKLVYERYVPKQCIEDICIAARECDVAPLTYYKDKVISERADEEYVIKEAFCNSASIMQVDNIPEFVDYPVSKVLVVGEHKKLLPVKEKLENKYSDILELFFSEDYFLEVVPKNVGKDASLAELLSQLGIKREELIACGDGLNDISMIKYAGLGIAMTLAFVRERQCFMNGDFQRGRNQQAAISGIINKATSPSILTSYSSVLEAATEVLYTNMPTSMITGLIKDQLADSTPWNVQSYAVSGRTQSNYCNLYGFYASTVVPDYDTVNIAIKLMNMIYNDETVNVDEYVESLENETATGSAQ